MITCKNKDLFLKKVKPYLFQQVYESFVVINSASTFRIRTFNFYVSDDELVNFVVQCRFRISVNKITVKCFWTVMEKCYNIYG